MLRAVRAVSYRLKDAIVIQFSHLTRFQRSKLKLKNKAELEPRYGIEP
jgi:hypothetical protein